MLGIQPVEGYFIVTREDLIFEVKGVTHPENFLIAYLRYVPDEGNRVVEGKSYRKVYKLGERETYLEQKFPKYLRYEKQYGRRIQAVSLDDIVDVFSPIEFLSRLRSMGKNLDNLQQVSVTLAEHLVHCSGIEWVDIGLTGSQLLGLASVDSDIDLVVYGTNQGRKIHSILKDYSHKIPGASRYSDEWLDKIVAFRWGEKHSNQSLLRRIERYKSLQGIYKGFEYFVRLVKRPEEVNLRYEDVGYEYIDYRDVNCVILDDQDSIYTPCVYVVDCKEVPELTKLVSYRGRFTEHVKNGTSVKARGRLEAVSVQNQDVYYQLVMGEDPLDYLLPLE